MSVVREAWAERASGYWWSNVAAREEFARLYVQAGFSLRQVAEVTGFSREWVRRILREEGVELRPRSAPGARADLVRDERGRVMFTREVRVEGEVAWWGDIYAMPSHVAVLVEFEAVTPSVVAALAGGGRSISPDLCGYPEGVVGGASDLAVGAVYERVTRDVWPISAALVSTRVGQLRRLCAALWEGVERGGVTIV